MSFLNGGFSVGAASSRNGKGASPLFDDFGDSHNVFIRELVPGVPGDGCFLICRPRFCQHTNPKTNGLNSGVAEESTGARASCRDDKGFAHKPSAALYIASGIGV